jgi:hypothetical protein
LKADPVNISTASAIQTTLSLVRSASSSSRTTTWTIMVDGRVEELIYLGDHIRVRMNVAGNDEFIVKVRNRGATPQDRGRRYCQNRVGGERLQSPRRRCLNKDLSGASGAWQNG